MKSIRFWAYFSAFLSLAISLALILLWCSNTGGLKVVNLNTFVGVTVALLGMIVTLAIAWQIYNALEMRSKIEELKQLEDRIIKQEKSLEQFKLETTRDLYEVLMAITRDHEAHPIAFYFALSALLAEIQLDELDEYEDILDSLELINEEIEENEEIERKDLDDVIEKDKKLRSYSNYRHIKRRYELIYNEFISKVKMNEEKQ